MRMYRAAVSKYGGYGFLYIHTGANPRFFSSYDSEFKITEQEEE